MTGPRQPSAFAPVGLPRPAEGWGLHAVDDDTVVALSERRRTVLRLRGLGLVVAQVDGRRDVADVLDALADRLDTPTVLGVLHAMLERRYLTVQAQAQPDAPACATAPACAVSPLGAVTLIAADALMQQALPAARAALTRSGICEQADAALRVLLASDFRHPAVLDHALAAERESRALLLCRPDGAQPLIGPLLAPPRTACIHCLRHWLGTQAPMSRWLEHTLGLAHVAAPLVHDPAGQAIALSLMAKVVQAHLAPPASAAPATPPPHGSVLAFDVQTLQTSTHAVVKRPQCPHCGDAQWMQRQAARPPVLADEPVTLREGGLRRQSAQQTFEQYRHLVSPLTGPICYLHPMPRRHGGLRQVFVSGYMVPPDGDDARGETDKVCAGKGSTAEQARASALCEALERFSGVHQGDEARVRATRRALARPEGDGALHFNALQQFSDRQFADRERINAASRDARRHVPLPFDDDAAIDWTPAWSLTDGCWRHVPLVYCYAQAPADSGRAWGIHNPNGSAAGTSVSEALLQGTLELVERDATAIWWYNRLHRPAIDLTAFGDPYFDDLVREYAAMGWRLWALDITHDLGIPVCVAVAWHPGQDRYAIGFGCHLGAHLAVQRALTEVNQLFDPTSQGPDPWDRNLLPQAGFLHPSPDVAPRGPADIGAWGGHMPARPLAACRQAFDQAGLEWLMVDKTRPDIGLNVVQAIVPGLRHFWPRFGPGRLYDVPVAMGWLPHPTAEEALNPAPLFL